jgi:hypothetical protein
VEGTTADVLVKIGRIDLLQKMFDICGRGVRVVSS